MDQHAAPLSSHRLTGPAFGRPEDKLRPVSMSEVDPGLRPAFAGMTKQRSSQNRRPRESGDPEPAPGLNRGHATEISGFPLARV